MKDIAKGRLLDYSCKGQNLKDALTNRRTDILKVWPVLQNINPSNYFNIIMHKNIILLSTSSNTKFTMLKIANALFQGSLLVLADI